MCCNFVFLSVILILFITFVSIIILEVSFVKHNERNTDTLWMLTGYMTCVFSRSASRHCLVLEQESDIKNVYFIDFYLYLVHLQCY